MPAAGAATVLVSEGTGQQRGNAQNAFNRAFCVTNTCRSISTGPLDTKTSSSQLQQAVDATPGDIILVGYSLGAAGTYDRLREWEKNPGQAPDPKRVVLIVTYGNPENKFGGDDRNDFGAGLPAQQPYQHLDVTMQYDSVADKPTRFGFYSAMNAQFARHFAYFENVDINDPDNLVYREGNTTYMLIEADTLPMLKFVQPFVSAQRMAELDAQYRPLIERDYDRPDYIQQGQGADWGNGTPPPSLTEAEESVVALRTEEPRTDKRSTDIDEVTADDGASDEADDAPKELTDEAEDAELASDQDDAGEDQDTQEQDTEQSDAQEQDSEDKSADAADAADAA